MRIFIFLFLVCVLSSCALFKEVDKEKAPLALERVDFQDLPGWTRDDHAAALNAFAKSCARILKRDPDAPFGPAPVGGSYGAWQPACRALQQDPPQSPAAAKAYFERWFTPYKASFGGRAEAGLFTGYYEPMLRGAAVKTGPYQYPLYQRPDDLVMVDLGEFRDDLKGQRIAGRVLEARLRPYEDRAQIEAGRWPHNDKALVWVDDPVDAFFLHIQGSGRVVLNDSSMLRVGYDGQNGHIYYAIGRELIKRGHLDKEEVSLQSIRQWLEENPEQAAEIMNLNRSYVFFKILNEDGPLGGEGLPLTAGRSLAVDRSRLPYGVPVWLDVAPPVDGEAPLRRLMVAQDTGGAIRGAVRGDVFWGYGERAEYLAGHMKAEGRYWLLLPKAAGHRQAPKAL